MIIDWQPILIFFGGAIAIMFFRGHQNHLAGMIFTIVLSLPIYEIWCKKNTGHTMSQNYTAWYATDSLWALVGMSLFIMAVIFLSFHFFLGRGE